MTPPIEPRDGELRRLFETSPVAMYRSTASGQLLAVNPAMAVLLGYDDLSAMFALNIDRDIYVDPTDRARLLALTRAPGGVQGEVVRWRMRSGDEILVRIYAQLVQDDRGVTFDVTAVDVTEASETHRELAERREQLGRTSTTLDLVLRQMAGMFWVVDLELRILSVGGAVEATLGYDADKNIGKTMYEFARDEYSSPDPIGSHLRAIAGEIVQYNSEYRGKTLANTIGPNRNSAGEIIGAIGTAIDVTVSHQLEHRMIEAQRAESLGVLAGGLAHDFNNLLVAILGNADLALREIAPGSPGRAAIDNIRLAGLRAAELTHDLLAYAGRGGVATTEVQLAPLIDELIRLTTPSLPPALRVEISVPAELAVRGDVSQVRQVVINLIANARDAIGAHAGTMSVRARAVVHDGAVSPDDVLHAVAGDYIEIAVSDTGPGMPRETRARMFDPFFTTKATGHGLGLASVLGILRAHGGGIRVRSTPGSGARFEILWPTPTPTIATPTAHPIGVAASPPPPTRTVLVVDDEDLVRDVVARMIEDLGYAAITAGDGRSALDRLDHEQIDAVLVDLTMPTMTGAELITTVRSRWPAMPIVLCSGFDRDRKAPVVADAYLPKPFRLDNLEQVFARLWPSAASA